MQIRAVMAAALALLSLLSVQVQAYDPSKASRYPSLDQYRPNIDSLTLHSDNSTGPASNLQVKPSGVNTILRTLADKLAEIKSINDYWKPQDGADYVPAFNRAMADMPASGGTIRLPRRDGCYPLSGTVTIGDGSASAPSTKQNVRLIGESGSATGGQLGFGTDKGTCLQYSGSAKIGPLLKFNGPIAITLQGITLEGGYLSVSANPTVTAANGSATLTSVSSTDRVVVGAYASGTGIPGGTIVTAVSGTSVTLSNPVTTSGSIVVTFQHNEATVDQALQLNHVFRSTIRNVGLKNARVGMRQDAYVQAQGVSIGSADNDFTNVWCENSVIAGGTAGSGCFDIGGQDANGVFDVARNTYTNLVGIGAGDPNYTGLVLRYADNLTFRGGMMYSLAPPALGYAVAYIAPAGAGTQYVYPAEISFHGMALIGRTYCSPDYDPRKNGGFGVTFWPMHSGDMLNPLSAGKGTIPTTCPSITGVDDRGIFFGWTQFRSWLADNGGNDVAYDTAMAFNRQTQLSQVTGVAAATQYAVHRIPAVAMRSRNSKDYPNSYFPLSDNAQYAYDRVVSIKQSGTWTNNNVATSIQVLINLGSQSAFQSGNINLPASPYYGSWRLEGELSQSGPGTQYFSGRLTLSGPGSSNGIAGPVQVDLVGDAQTTVDLTADQFLTSLIAPNNPGFVWNDEKSLVTVH